MNIRLRARAKHSAERLTKTDAAAFFVLFLMFVLFFLFASRGIGVDDEPFYYTIVQRVLRGDRLLFDEWHVSQMNFFLAVVPYKLAVLLCKGTDGVILTLRYLYLIWHAGLAVWFWTKIRRYGIFGLLGTVFFFAYAPIVSTFGYHNLSIDLLLIVVSLLFLSETLTPLRCFFAGLFFAGVVLAQPLTCTMYAVYCFFCLLYVVLRKRKSSRMQDFAFLLRGKSWLFVSVGIGSAAVPVLIILLHGKSLSQFFQAIPDLMTDSEYQFASGQEFLQTRLLLKPQMLLRAFGAPAAVIMAVLVIAAILFHFFLRRSNKCRAALCILTCIHMMALYLALLLKYGSSGVREEIVYVYYVPIQIYSFVFYLLRSRADKTALGFLCAGALFTLAVDYSSCVVLGIGGACSQFCACISFRDILSDLIADLRTQASGTFRDIPEDAGLGVILKKVRKKASRSQADRKTVKKSRSRTLRKNDSTIYAETVMILLVFVGTVIPAAFWSAAGIHYLHLKPHTETNRLISEHIEPLDVKIAFGPHKGIRTTATVKTAYEAALSELDAVQNQTEGPLYIFALFPSGYLHTNMPYACYSAWFVEEASDYERQLHYWSVHPERTPQIIYIPMYTFYYYQRETEDRLEKSLAFMQSHFDCDVRQGTAGYILTVKNGTKT